jgi:hypothetical protein
VNLTAAPPRIMASADGNGLVSQAGAVLLAQALRVTGLDRGLRSPGRPKVASAPRKAKLFWYVMLSSCSLGSFVSRWRMLWLAWRCVKGLN